jgi:hypothetical protein
VSSYVVELKMLSQTCRYGSNLPDALRDRFISGLRDEKLQKQLINTENLTFDQAVTTATNWEMADEHIKTMRAGNAESDQYHAVTENRVRGRFEAARQRGATMAPLSGYKNVNKPGVSSQTGAIPKRCARCGINNPRHLQSNCWTLSKPCFSCGQFGHSAKMCRRTMKANFCGEQVDDDSDTSTVDEQGSTNNRINHWTTSNIAAGGIPIMLFPGNYTGLFPEQFPPNFGVGGQASPAVEGDHSGEEDDMMQQLRIGHIGPTFSAPSYADLYLEQQFTKMEIDTGACTSVISYVMHLIFFF